MNSWRARIVVMCGLFVIPGMAHPNLLAATAWQETIDSDNEDTQLIAGLRERRLFRLAEIHCHDLLSTPNLTPVAAANLTIELIKTQTARAILEPESHRDSNWASAIRTADSFLQGNPNHSRALLVQVQLALTHLSHGQLLRQELAAEMTPESARELALAELRLANSQLNELQRAIHKKIPEQRGRTLDVNELTTEELMALNNNVRFQSAIVNVNRAQLYEANDRLNRIDALNSVLGSLDGVQRETSAGQPLWWESQILQIECLRFLGRLEEAATIVGRLSTSIEAKTIPPALLEQQLRLSLDRHDSDAAMKALQAAEGIERRTPQLDLARLAVALDFSQRGTGAEKTDWLNRAAQLARRIEVEHGSYWGRRAKLILIGNRGVETTDIVQPNDPENKMSKDGSGSSAELDLMIGLAEQAERKERFDDAVKAYDRAANMAKQIDAQPLAFSLSVRASQALEKMQQHEMAAVRLIKLANDNPDYKLAAAAHIRGCWNWAQGIGFDAGKRQRFTELLEKHLQRWPIDPSAAQVHVWLGGQQQNDRQWQAAYGHYRAVPIDDPLFGQAIPRAVYCARQWLDSLSVDERQTVASEVTRQLQSVSKSAREDSSGYIATIHAVTEIGVRYGTLPPTDMIEALKNLIKSDRANASGESAWARPWLFSLLAFEPSESSAAEQLLAEFGNDKEGLAIAEQGIVAISTHHANLVSTESQQWRLRLIEAAVADPTLLTDGETTAWLYRKSEALADLQQEIQALAVLLELEKILPTDAGIQLRIARLMTRINGEQDADKPLQKWRQLAVQLKPHTESWYEAKYNVALLLEKTGQRDEARKLLEYLQAIPPGWENSVLKNEFVGLLSKVSGSPKR